MSTSTAARSIPVTKRPVTVAIYAAVVAFLTYASVYAYRKPFTIATFDGISFWGVKYQELLIISQGLGYMLSKFSGIRFIAELKRIGRWKTSAVLMGAAWLSLLIFAVIPAPYGMLCLFVNGYMLGFMWGIVFSYVEGRRATDFIGAAMAVSFIFAGGFTRDVAKTLRDSWQVPEQWLGFATGLVFLLPLILFLYMLEKIPGPDEADIQQRTVRMPMQKAERKDFLKLFGAGIGAIIITYLFLTIMRDIRDNFMANIWTELGYGSDRSIFTKTETITSLVVLVMVGLLVLIRKNIKAFRFIHWVVLAGFLLAGISSALFLGKQMSGALWMQLVGLGLYLGYIPFNCIFFERMIASFRVAGNVGFLIYLVDAYGYLGSSSVILGRYLFQIKLTWSQFYPNAVVIFSVIGVITTIFSYIYFNRKYRLLKPE